MVFLKTSQRLRELQTLYDVGLSYIKLGSLQQLSGGGTKDQASNELSKRAGKTYISWMNLRGLHFADIHKLTELLDRLCEGETPLSSLNTI